MYHRPSPQSQSHHSDDLFRSRLDNLIDMRHPLVRLAQRINWSALDVAWGARAQPAGAGNPALPVRLVAGLLYLKHMHNLSDEAVCAGWLENPYWQCFCGEVWFQTDLPCDPSSLTRYRQRLGEAGLEELLALTVETGKAMKAVSTRDLQRVVVDSTVQEKAIAYPTDSRLLEIARRKLVQFARRQGLALRRSYEREGPALRVQAGRFAHARQMKRLRKTVKRQRTLVGALLRDILRKLAAHTLTAPVQAAWDTLRQRIERLLTQKMKDKRKLYALHAPEVECISKGKARQPYEFGVKVGIAVTAKQGFIVGARSFPGNPYDGDTLHEQLEQAETLTGVKIQEVLVDLGYRGRDSENPGRTILHRGKAKRLTHRQRGWLKRRQSIEPIIGHLKSDCGLGRCSLKGSEGDAYHPIVCAAGYNLRFLLRWIAAFLWMFLEWLQGAKVNEAEPKDAEWVPA